MTSLAFKLELVHRLFEPATEIPLAQTLSSFHRAGCEDVVAICLRYFPAFIGPARDGLPKFVVRCGNQIEYRTYCNLSPLLQAKIADAVVRLEADVVFKAHLEHFISEMGTDRETDDTYVFATANSVSLFSPDVAYRGGHEWSQEAVARFCRFLCRKATDTRDAIDRHEDLQALVRMWRQIIESAGGLNSYPVASMRPPNVGDLLP